MDCPNGRPIVFRCDSQASRDQWVSELSAALSALERTATPALAKQSSIVTHLQHAKHDVWDIPESILGKIMWAVSLPANLIFMYTIPDVKEPRFERFYWLTIIMFLLWLPILSYVMVTSLNEISEAWDIPPAVMAMTVGAAGTSFPDFMAASIC